MRKPLLHIFLLMGSFAGLLPAAQAAPPRPANTYSIVARDPVTGDLGVAVQSHWFAVGLDVPWAEAGVGVVATQSFVNPAYGYLGLDQLRSGKSAPDVLRLLLAKDGDRELRQVAVLDAQGQVAAHTGKRCIDHAGHLLGKGYSVQANLMQNDRVWPEMAKAFEGGKGDLAERLLLALEAAQKAGGDQRGQQSAALIVVSGKATGKPWLDRRYHLRVDDHPEPLKELRRLLTMQRAYHLMNEGDLALERKDLQAAQKHYGAAQLLAPQNQEMLFWHAVALESGGKPDEALILFRKLWKGPEAERYKALLPRLIKSGLLPEKSLERVIDRPIDKPKTPPKNDLQPTFLN